MYSADRMFSKRNYLLVISFELINLEPVFASLQWAAKFHPKLNHIHRG